MHSIVPNGVGRGVVIRLIKKGGGLDRLLIIYARAQNLWLKAGNIFL